MNNEINNLRKELVIMKELDLKPNYAQLARKHNCDWRTVKKYHNGYEGKSKSRNRASKLDNLKNEIKQKLELPGATISAVYQYFLKKDCKIGTYSNFNAFVKKISYSINKIYQIFILDLKQYLVNNFNLIGKKI